VAVGVVTVGGVRPNDVPDEAWAAAMLAPLTLIPVAIVLNRPVQKAREQAQRDTAVRIARETLRRRMAKLPRGGV
jgi:hypothetical protein